MNTENERVFLNSDSHDAHSVFHQASAKAALAQYKAFIEVLLRTPTIMNYPKVVQEFLEFPSDEVL